MICVTTVMMRDPRASGHQFEAARFVENEGRAHLGRRPLFAPGALASPPMETVDIGGAGLGGEIVELVVEQHAGPLRHEPGTVRQIERISVGDRVALGVDDRKMSRLIALVALRPRRPRCPWRGARDW